jgi:hypothetical protein
MNRHRTHLLARSVIAVAATMNTIGLVILAHDHPTTGPVFAAFAVGTVTLFASGSALSAAVTAGRIGVEMLWYRRQNTRLRDEHPLRPLESAPAVLASAGVPAEELNAVTVALNSLLADVYADAYASGDGSADDLLMTPPRGWWLRTHTEGRHAAHGWPAPAARGYWAEPADSGRRAAA